MKDFNVLMEALKQRKYLPYYIIDGDEPFYLDAVISAFEEQILAPAEKDFNLTVLYGRDTNWQDVVTAARRFPMFAERQVAILKDAASMRELKGLEGYLERPSPTTVLLIEHRGKKVDGRSKMATMAKKAGALFTSEAIKDEAMPRWIRDYGKSIGLEIGEREAALLAGNLGHDLQKIVNELGKVRLNMGEDKVLTVPLIKKYIGVSHEYTAFELPEALTGTNRDHLAAMVAYFVSNPKAAPMPLVIGMCYSHFAPLYVLATSKRKKPDELQAASGLNAYRLKMLAPQAQRFSEAQLTACMLVLGTYSRKAVGIGTTTRDGALLVEMVGKINLILSG